ILGLTGEKNQRVAAERILRDGLNVRQTEGLVAHLLAREAAHGTRTTPVNAKPKEAHVANLENQLRERLGTKINLRYSQGKGALEIVFFSDAELERILQILGVTTD